uniref:NADH-ubiquinone oxidoreductase chain 6 n=1 Tax=Tenebrionoidea sp. 1 KM-2017 TaxID=2219464 RepID=A0A346RJE1_9CUCU|nr:NADH dehydrogenase subunit 6 [Tenebrionoidea sp. 1 KM-2017]
MMILMLNISLSFMLVFMNHPLIVGLILISQTLLISLICGNMTFTFWFSYILFLVMVGGMLIIFMYMTSIASNEKFKFKLTQTIPIMVVILVSLATFNNINYLMINITKTSMNNQIIDLSTMLNKYSAIPLNIIMIFLMAYLFIVMIAIVKITDFKQGPLRQLN